jgi:aryl-alcohol dehydrogenase-like predicted oxidoreductase
MTQSTPLTRPFGQTGFSATVIGLGAWPIGQKETDDGSTGSYGRVDPKDAQRTVERYVELGGNFIDTARNYGTSEEIIGRCDFMRTRRESIFLATKTGQTGSREAFRRIEDELTTSLRNLRTEYVDLYQIHNPPEDPDLIDELLDIFSGLRERGLIRAIGASVKGPDVTDATVALAKRYVDTGRVDALQLIYSMLRRGHEETFAHAARHGVTVIARTVLESGFLTGKYRPGDSFDGHRSRWGAERRDAILEAAGSLASRLPAGYGSLAQAALRFAAERPEVGVVIPGARSEAQVEANWSVNALPPLPPEFLTAVDALPVELADLANTGG